MIRAATPADEPALRACAEAAYAPYIPRIGRRPAPMDADFAAQVARGQAWVACDAGDRVLGYTRHDHMVKRQFLLLFDKLDVKCEAERWNEPVERFNWHALRRYAVSTWIEAGLAPKTIQTFAGHSSLQVTMDRYGHLFRSDDHKRAMDAIAHGLLA